MAALLALRAARRQEGGVGGDEDVTRQSVSGGELTTRSSSMAGKRRMLLLYGSASLCGGSLPRLTDNTFSFSSPIQIRRCFMLATCCVVLCLSALVFLPKGAEAIAPPNKFLADTVWPIAQHDNYAQASTLNEGPTEAGSVDYLFNTQLAGALTVLYTPDAKVVWGSSLTSVFKVDRSASEMRLIDSVEKRKELRRKDTFRGIYSVLTKQGIFYISSSNVISAYTDKEEGDSLSGIRHLKDYDFSKKAKPSERILALSLSYDGMIVFCTNLGGVGILPRSLTDVEALQYATADEGTNPSVSVTNSISIDEHGGIYIVTSRYMHRMWWDSEARQLYSLPPPPVPQDETRVGSFGSAGCDQARLCQIWSTPYAVDEDPILGRPTKEGSGTTPSLLKDEHTGRLYVMIADGQRRQEVLAIDSVTGEIAATAPVSFRDDGEQSEESYTEQSILVNKNKLLVTQNAMTPPGQIVNELLKTIQAPEIVRGMDLPEFIQQNVYLLPVLLGDSPRGFQQFELDTSGETPELRTTWTRDDIGCPNAIPTMSETTGVMYCVGKRQGPVHDLLLNSVSTAWTIAAFDWETGRTVFTSRTGGNLLYNSLYAATQIGPDKEIIYGSVGGLVRLRAENPSLLRAIFKRWD